DGIRDWAVTGVQTCALPIWAAEVHVDDVGARRLDHPGSLCHRTRVGAEDLDRERVLVGTDPEVPERALVSMLDARHRDHLGADRSEERRVGKEVRPDAATED